jgi:xylose isomerase
MITDKRLTDMMDKRYEGWNQDFAQQIMKGEMSMDALAERMLQNNVDPKPVSGKQELLENIVNQMV